MQIKSEKIEFVETESITKNPKNPNAHSLEQIERLVKLIKKTGFRNPLIVSKKSGFLIAGHGRLEVAKILQMKKVPVIFQDFENEAEEYSFMVSDNAIAEWSKLNLDQIKMDIDGFEDFEIDMLGLKDFEGLDFKIEDEEVEINGEKKFLLLLELKDENELMMFFNEMQSREVKTRIME
jgi:hypothetical protein